MSARARPDRSQRGPGEGLTRRELGRAALAALAAGVLPGCGPAGTGEAPPLELGYRPGEPIPWRNWGGNQACRPARRAAPASEDEMVAALTRGTGPLRPVGAGHSFSALVPSDGTLLASDLLVGLREVDAGKTRAEAWAGTRLHQLGPLLAAQGQALPNQPDIDYQTLGGALATSTHGTGATFASLSAYVDALALATPRGELIECSAERNADLFAAARCSLGALGVVTRAWLRNVPAFELVEVSRFESLETVLDDVEERRRESRHFEFHAFPHTDVALTVTTDPPAPGASPAGSEPEDPEAIYTLREIWRGAGRLPWVGPALYARLVAAATGGAVTRRVGPSHQVLAHPRLVRFREMEYAVPAEAGPACLREILATIARRRIPVVFPLEYRYVAADDVWLSQFYEREACTISVHQFADEDHRAYFAEIEPIFWRYEGRPHWGKLHGLDADALAARLPRLREFRALRRELDPEGRLLNPHLRHTLGA